MATPSEVVGLLAEIAGTGGRIDQAKAISRAVKALNSLDADKPNTDPNSLCTNAHTLKTRTGHRRPADQD